MNHRMETISWLTKHSDFVLSCRVYIELGKPERAVCLRGWDKGVHKNHLGKVLQPFILFLQWGKLIDTRTSAANTWHTCPGRTQTGK